MTDPDANAKRLVLVDDDGIEGLILRRFIGKECVDVELVVFQSGRAFLDYMEAVKSDETLMPDLVLLDARMGALTGFEVLSSLRRDSHFKDRPKIVMFSNSRDKRDIQRALELGASAFRSKPMGGEAYLALLAELGFAARVASNACARRRPPSTV